MPDPRPNPLPPTLDYASPPSPQAPTAITYIFITLSYLFGALLLFTSLAELLVSDPHDLPATLIFIGAALFTIALHLHRQARRARSRARTIKI